MEIDKESDKIEDTRDEELLIKAQAGDSKAFGELWMYYRLRLHASAIRRTGKLKKLKSGGQKFEKAEDIVNETFLITWKTINNIPPHVKFRMWLWGVFRNVIRGQVKLWERPHPFSPESLEILIDGNGTNHNGDDENPGDVLREYIFLLKSRHREAIECYYLKGMTQVEYGEKIGKSREVARRQICFAVDELRRTLEINDLTIGDFQ